ncbi:ABC transporter substrate-binding protein [Nocardioides zeae]|uniref:ABC transporter substrate-binding protein n=1 Tax=Nocardioides imazamoxiresistens TaxID=3231893 RepID=A0ABU3PRX2_9ACTN|nr:ABC transporter substrate-binding protein [Nocardioides zeae]MDT9591525.1 ABC transporter substrate-binding protein [Nocardioides zeae]
MRRRTSRLLAAPLALATLLAATACAAPADDDAAAGAETRTVTTDQGDVEVPVEPLRVVLLNFALAGYLYDLDVPVTTVTPEAADTDGTFSEFWADDAEAQGTEFMTWTSDGFDLQAILDADPDLIVAGGIGFPLFQAVEAYDQLSDIAPTVVVSGERTTWQEQLEFLAVDVFDQPDVYEEALATYDERVAEVAGAIDVPDGESAFLSITSDGAPYVLIEDQGLPTVFSALGFTPAPLFATGDFEPYTAGGDSFELSTEQVGQYVDQESVFVVGFNGAPVDVETLAENPVYAALPAFADDQAYQLPYYVYRGDFDETLALLDFVEDTFATP